MAVQAAHAGAVIHFDVPEGIVGQWDALALEQIADNLLSNAIKYGDCKPVQVMLREEWPSAVLSVRDHGSGISQENLARIFARFERAVAQGRTGGFGVACGWSDAWWRKCKDPSMCKARPARALRSPCGYPSGRPEMAGRPEMPGCPEMAHECR
jgi:hypothetical protein